MFVAYDIEVYPNDWMVVLLDIETEQITQIHNDRGALKERLSSNQILVGFNNYRYTDHVLAALLSDESPQAISQAIMSGEKVTSNLARLTLDVAQETKVGLSLKEVQANKGLAVFETPVPFETEILTSDDVQRILEYCENDVRTVQLLFQEREAYFASKFEMVTEFKLPNTDVKRTQAKLVERILRAKKIVKPKNDRLALPFAERLPVTELPAQVLAFYERIRQEAKGIAQADELEKRHYDYELAGVQHRFGFGGLHGARENYVSSGRFIQIDVRSFYPTLMIRNNWLSRAAQIENFQELYEKRLQLQAKGDSKENVYKRTLTATFGASKSTYNFLFDPGMANAVTVNGQLILTHLILLLEPFCELIQSNTDGIIIRYENDDMRSMIDNLLKRFAEYYQLQFQIDEAIKIAQRDVNNYCLLYKDGRIKAAGCFSKYGAGTFEQNSLTIIDKALVEFYLYGVPIQKTVIDCFKRGEIDRFQIIARTGNFDGMVAEVNGKMQPLQKVNRIFATNRGEYGGVFKKRGEQLHKVPNTSDQSMVFNGHLSQLDKRLINLNYYMKLIQGSLFEHKQQ